jgi:hypothetical protein
VRTLLAAVILISVWTSARAEMAGAPLFSAVPLAAAPPGTCPTLVPFQSTPPLLATTVQPMACFLNSVGINLHGTQWSNYGTPANYLPFVYSGGWRHIRTNFDQAAATATQIQQLGLHNIAIALAGDGCLTAYGGYSGGAFGNTAALNAAAASCVNWLVNNGVAPYITQLLGPNEVETGQYNGWQTGIPRWLQAIYTAIKANPQTSHIQLTTSGFAQAGNPGPWSTYSPTMQSSFTDMGDIHTTGGYGPTYNPGLCTTCYPNSTGDFIIGNDAWFQLINNNTAIIAGTAHPFLNSENSHPDTAVAGICPSVWSHAAPQSLNGLMHMRHYFEMYRWGITANDSYELVQETGGDGCWGFLDQNFNPKQEYNIIAATTTLMADAGTASVTPLSYPLTGAGPLTMCLVFQKTDGSYWFAIWEQEEVWQGQNNGALTTPPAKLNLTLTVPGTNNYTSYLPVDQNQTINGTNSTGSAAGAGNFTFSDQAGVTLIKVVPSGAAQTAFYVATNGNDSAPGTLAQPFATLGKALNTVAAGGTIKTIYVRAGTYNLGGGSTGSCNGHNQKSADYHIQSANQNNLLISYYSPDGIGSAVFDGGGTTDLGLCVNNTTGVSVVGLTWQNFPVEGMFMSGGTGNTFQWNTCSGVTAGADCLGAQNSQNATFDGNYVHDNSNRAISAITSGANVITGLTIKNNMAQNNCTATADCGAFYAQDNRAGCNSTGISITNNYSDKTSGGGGGMGVYLDDGLCNATISGNVTIGNGNYCFQIHGGNSDTFSGNICDLYGAGGANTTVKIMFYQQDALGNNMSGNAMRNNFTACNSSSSPCGGGYSYSGTPPTALTISNNGYDNYGSGTGGIGGVQNACSGTGCGSESGATSIPTPKLTGWGALIDPSSALLAAPVSMPSLGYGWGPPGLAVPQTQTAPSWPHAC